MGLQYKLKGPNGPFNQFDGENIPVVSPMKLENKVQGLNYSVILNSQKKFLITGS